MSDSEKSNEFLQDKKLIAIKKEAELLDAVKEAPSSPSSSEQSTADSTSTSFEDDAARFASQLKETKLSELTGYVQNVQEALEHEGEEEEGSSSTTSRKSSRDDGDQSLSGTESKSSITEATVRKPKRGKKKASTHTSTKKSSSNSSTKSKRGGVRRRHSRKGDEKPEENDDVVQRAEEAEEAIRPTGHTKKKLINVLESDDLDDLKEKLSEIEEQLLVHDEHQHRQMRQIYAAKGLPNTSLVRRVILCAMCIVLLLIGVSRSHFTFVQGMRALTVDKELLVGDSHVLKTFDTITNLAELWQFLRGPLLLGLLGPDDGFDEPRMDVYGSARLLGSVQVRQLRVTGVRDCAQSNEAIRNALRGVVRANDSLSASLTCYPPYSSASESREAFGRAEVRAASRWRTLSAGRRSPFEYSEFATSFEQGFHGLYSGDGGFLALLDTQSSAADLAELRDAGWVDASTRVLMIEFTLLNGHTGTLLCARLVAEVPLTGGLVTYWTMNAVEAADFLRNGRWWVPTLEVLFVALAIAVVLGNIVDVGVAFRDHFRGVETENRDRMEVLLEAARVTEPNEAVQLSAASTVAIRQFRRLMQVIQRLVPERLRHFTSVLELVYGSLALIVVVLRFVVGFEYARVLDDAAALASSSTMSEQYALPLIESQRLASLQNALDAMLGFLALTAWLLFALHMIATSVSLYQVQVIRIALRKFYAFSFLFGGLYVGLSISTHFLFHGRLFEFSTWPRSLFGTMHLLLGQRDFAAIRVASPLFGPILYVLIVVFGTIFVFNLLIGFLGSAIGDARTVLEEQASVRRLVSKANRERRLMTAYIDMVQSRIDKLEKEKLD